MMRDRRSHRGHDPLLRLSRELLRTEDLSTLASSLPSIVESAFGSRLVILCLYGRGQFFSQAGKALRGGDEIPEFEVRDNVSSREGAERLDRLVIPLTIAGEAYGYLLVHGGTLTRKTAGQAGELVSAALERAESFARNTQVMAERENCRLRRVLVDFLMQELRTPLTSIKGAATSLLWIELSPDAQRELLTIIDEESDRIDRVFSSAVLLGVPVTLQRRRLRQNSRADEHG